MNCLVILLLAVEIHWGGDRIKNHFTHCWCVGNGIKPFDNRLANENPKLA